MIQFANGKSAFFYLGIDAEGLEPLENELSPRWSTPPDDREEIDAAGTLIVQPNE